jgi:hypothetical protein
MKMLFSTILMLIAGAFPCWSQTTANPDKPNWHFEIGGSFADVNSNYGQWYSGDTKIS